MWVSSDGGECIRPDRNNTSGGSKENQRENKETNEVREKSNDKLDRLTENKEKLHGSRGKHIERHSDDLAVKSVESKEKHNETKDKNGSKDNISDQHEKQSENKEKVKDTKDRPKDTLGDKNKQEGSHVESVTSSVAQAPTVESGKVDKIIIRMGKDQSKNSSDMVPSNVKIEFTTAEVPKPLSETPLILNKVPKPNNETPAKEKESKSEIVQPAVPSAFESNLMHMYSSVKALKEAGRPVANAVNTSREEREGKHQCSESLNSGNSNQPRYNDSTGRSKHHSSRSKSDSGHRSRHRDHSRDHRHDSKSRSHKHSCSRCHKRSKIKRASIGVQCRRDKTFEKFVCSSNKFESTVPMPRPTPLTNNKSDPCKFSHLIRVETYPNGGASVVHLYQDEIQNLSPTEMDELVGEYFKVSRFVYY